MGKINNPEDFINGLNLKAAKKVINAVESKGVSSLGLISTGLREMNERSKTKSLHEKMLLNTVKELSDIIEPEMLDLSNAESGCKLVFNVAGFSKDKIIIQIEDNHTVKIFGYDGGLDGQRRIEYSKRIGHGYDIDTAKVDVVNGILTITIGLAVTRVKQLNIS